MDEDIEELKELVKENIEATEETNRMLRKMRRNAMWGWVFYIVWWLLVAGVAGAAYYYYLQPYVTKVEQLYGLSEEQSKNWNEQITSFLKYFGQKAPSSTQPAPAPSPEGTSTASSTPQ